MKYYEYSQNNSGGWFEANENVAHRVFIQAKSSSEADAKAEEIGIYFDGCLKGMDCRCCGDRWSEAASWNEKDAPEIQIFGGGMTTDLQAGVDADSFCAEGEPGAIVYHADGRKEIIRKSS